MRRRLCDIKSSGLTLVHHYARRTGALEVFGQFFKSAVNTSATSIRLLSITDLTKLLNSEAYMALSSLHIESANAAALCCLHLIDYP
jgi:hypothetical protein